jgi:two-component system response regulator
MLFEQSGPGSPTKQLVEILLVEDNPRDVRLTLRGFEKAKIANPVHVVHDGGEALDFIFATGPYTHRHNFRSPQIILLDLNLPKKSGIEVLQELKASEKTRDIPVIVLTASNRHRDVAECQRLGAVNYLVKPVEFQNFSEVTARLSLAWTLVKPKGGIPSGKT